MNGFSRGSIGELEKKLAEATERAEQAEKQLRKLECAVNQMFNYSVMDGANPLPCLDDWQNLRAMVARQDWAADTLSPEESAAKTKRDSTTAQDDYVSPPPKRVLTGTMTITGESATQEPEKKCVCKSDEDMCAARLLNKPGCTWKSSNELSKGDK